jgi:hypothetical protein
MRYGRLTWILVRGVLGGALAWWAAADRAGTAHAAPATMPTGTQVIDLQFVEEPMARMMFGALLKDGKAEVPFPNAAGKLLLQYKGGKLQADTNGDGVIDGKDAPPVKPRQAMIRADAMVGGKAVSYPIWIGDVQDNRLIVLGSRGALEGTVGPYTVHIGDGTNLGRFDAGAMSSIYVRPSSTPMSATVPYVPWSRTIDVDGSLYQIELLGNGAQLKVTPYTGEVAQVTLEPSSGDKKLSADVTLSAVDGAQVGRLQPGETKRLVPGKYRVDCRLEYQERNRVSCASGDPSDKAKPFEAKPGGNVLKVGAPFTLQFSATRSGEQVEFTSATLLGCSGEAYRPGVQTQNNELFAAYARLGEKETKLTDLGFS